MRITLDSTTGIIVDVQERLLPAMHESEATLNRITTLIRGLEILGVPMLLTEQYPQGLGATVEAVRQAFSTPPEPIIKSAFSCCDESAFVAALESQTAEGAAQADRADTADRNHGRTVLIAGIESHVCVLQTTIDLLAREHLPVVVTDATSSRTPRDRDIAFRRIEREGGRLTTVESVLFELTRVSGTPRFKEISRLVK